MSPRGRGRESDMDSGDGRCPMEGGPRQGRAHGGWHGLGCLEFWAAPWDTRRWVWKPPCTPAGLGRRTHGLASPTLGELWGPVEGGLAACAHSAVLGRTGQEGHSDAGPVGTGRPDGHKQGPRQHPWSLGCGERTQDMGSQRPSVPGDSMSSVPPCPPSPGPGLPRWACSRAEQVFASQSASERLGGSSKCLRP